MENLLFLGVPILKHIRVSKCFEQLGPGEFVLVYCKYYVEDVSMKLCSLKFCKRKINEVKLNL